jgi:hypothetical protein
LAGAVAPDDVRFPLNWLAPACRLTVPEYVRPSNSKSQTAPVRGPRNHRVREVGCGRVLVGAVLEASDDVARIGRRATVTGSRQLRSACPATQVPEVEEVLKLDPLSTRTGLEDQKPQRVYSHWQNVVFGKKDGAFTVWDVTRTPGVVDLGAVDVGQEISVGAAGASLAGSENCRNRHRSPGRPVSRPPGSHRADACWKSQDRR